MSDPKTTTIEKQPGADWTVYYMDTADGDRSSMSIFGVATAEEALAEARFSFGEGASEIEFVAVIRDGVDLELYEGGPKS